jgi:hypothetical protein
MTKARDLADNAEGTKTKAVDAKGDLIVGTAADTAARLAVGTDGHLLTAASGEATGLIYALDPVTDAVTTKGDIVAATAADTLSRLGVGAVEWTTDLIYGTAADTVARLGIGSTSQVLQVSSGGIPEWAAPSSGSMTQLATGTLSGTIVTLSLELCGVFKDQNGGTYYGVDGGGGLRLTAAITSLSITINGSTTFTGGTYTLYGVK